MAQVQLVKTSDLFIPMLVQGLLVVANDVIPPGVAVPVATSLSKATARLGTAPVGAAVIIRVLSNGSTITTLTIADGLKTATNPGLAVSLPAGAVITLDITQVGSTTPGADLAVELECH